MARMSIRRHGYRYWAIMQTTSITIYQPQTTTNGRPSIRRRIYPIQSTHGKNYLRTKIRLVYLSRRPMGMRWMVCVMCIPIKVSMNHWRALYDRRWMAVTQITTKMMIGTTTMMDRIAASAYANQNGHGCLRPHKFLWWYFCLHGFYR